MKISTLLFPLAFFGSSLPAFAAHYDCAVFSQFSFDIFLSLSGDELAELDTDPGFTFRIAVGKPLSAMPLTALDDLYADYLQCGSEYGEAYRSDGLIAFLNMRTYVIKTTSSVAFESQQSSGLRTLTSPMTSKDPQVSKQDRALDAEFDQLAEKLKTIFVDMSARPNGQKVLKVEEKESFEGFSAQIEKTFSSDSDLRKVGLLAIVRKISDLNSDDQEYIDNAHKSEQAEAEKQAKRAEEQKANTANDAMFNQLASQMQPVLSRMKSSPVGETFLTAEEKRVLERLKAELDQKFSSPVDPYRKRILVMLREIDDLEAANHEYIHNAPQREQAEAERKAKEEEQKKLQQQQAAVQQTEAGKANLAAFVSIYMIADLCQQHDVAFSQTEIEKIRTLLKDTAAKIGLPKDQLDQIWSASQQAFAAASSNLTENDCTQTKQQLIYLMPSVLDKPDMANPFQ